MSRAALLLPACLLAAACSTDGLSISHMSVMQSQTRGVVLYDDGQRGHAAMWNTTCEFDTLNGWLISDHDLPTESEEIVDTFEGEVLGRSDVGAHPVWRLGQRDLELRGVVDGRLFADGLVVLRETRDGGCEARWDDGAVVALDASACAADALDVDREDGSLFVRQGAEVVKVDREGVNPFDGAADLVVFDRTTELVYLANKGEREVWANDLGGGLVWSTKLPGAITAMDDMGRRGAVMVVIEDGDRGRVVVLDGLTGDRRTEAEAPSAEVDVTVSEDGTTMAVTLETEVHFYDLTEEGEEPKKRKTLGADPSPAFAD